MEGSKRIEHAQSKLTETQNLRISEVRNAVKGCIEWLVLMRETQRIRSRPVDQLSPVEYLDHFLS